MKKAISVSAFLIVIIISLLFCLNSYAAEYGDYEEIPAPEESAVLPYVEKQVSDEWRLGKTPRFDLEIENRFPWGNIQLLLTLRQCRVDELDVYTDAIDVDLAGEVKQRLMGADFSSRSLADALFASEKEQIRELAQYILDQAY